jgi:MoxR-like ATPase
LEERLSAFADTFVAMRGAIEQTIFGQREAVEQVLIGLFGGGHLLLEGVPGLGKTLLARTVARLSGLSYQRIQLTPDLMPTDITGTPILVDEAGARRFEFQPGPIFAQLVLADEINRATPRTQSALLEAMEEQHVTIGRETHPLGPPFHVLATQNPIELEGTYPLPEAQLDRFLLKVPVDLPARGALVDMLAHTTGAPATEPEPMLTAETLIGMQALARSIPAARPVLDYAARIVLNTHPDRGPAAVRDAIRLGASPRGAQALIAAAKVHAIVAGRAHTAYEDVEALCVPALRHRLLLSYAGEAEGKRPAALIAEVLAATPREASS